jgi:hypothetical protein
MVVGDKVEVLLQVCWQACSLLIIAGHAMLALTIYERPTLLAHYSAGYCRSNIIL